MKAIIHIGTQKTGTTTLQSFLMENRPALSSQGFRVQPMSPRTPAQMELGLAGVIRAGDVLTSANKEFVMGARGRTAQVAHVNRFEAMLREGVRTWPEETYLASSEQIHAWLFNRPRIEALHRFLADIFDEVRYVVYYRPQTDFILSTYSEGIKRGEWMDMDEHIQRFLPHLNFFRRASLWADVVGRENLSVRLFDRGVMHNGDLIDDFAQTVGFDRHGMVVPSDQNLSLTVEDVALRRRLGRYMPAYFKNGLPNPLFRGLIQVARLRRDATRTKLSLTEEQRALIRNAVAEPNEKMRKMFFPERETLFTKL